MSIDLKTANFIAKAIDIHGNRYDYSRVEYLNAKTKITIMCKDHGDFQQTPTNHLSGYNCQKCANNLKMSTELFVKRATKIHSNKYDYVKVNYANADTKITITCKEHGDFEQIPDFHLNRKSGCPKCANNITLQGYEFIAKSRAVHGDKYDYSQVEYVNNKINIQIICKQHGHFEQTPTRHMGGDGCPHCINKTEYKLWLLLKEKYPTVKRQFKVEWCKKKRCLPFDFAIEELKLIVELDGDQHFKQIANWKSPELQLEDDIYKMKCANDNGYSIVRVMQKDVTRHDWSLETILSELDDIPTIKNIFICSNSEYDNHEINQLL